VDDVAEQAQYYIEREGYVDQISLKHVDGAKITRLNPRFFRKLGFERIGWPSCGSITGELLRVKKIYGEDSDDSDGGGGPAADEALRLKVDPAFVSPQFWSLADVSSRLRAWGLGAHAKTFRRAGVDGPLLLRLLRVDLEGLGLSSRRAGALLLELRGCCGHEEATAEESTEMRDAPLPPSVAREHRRATAAAAAATAAASRQGSAQQQVENDDDDDDGDDEQELDPESPLDLAQLLLECGVEGVERRAGYGAEGDGVDAGDAAMAEGGAQPAAADECDGIEWFGSKRRILELFKDLSRGNSVLHLVAHPHSHGTGRSGGGGGGGSSSSSSSDDGDEEDRRQLRNGGHSHGGATLVREVRFVEAEVWLEPCSTGGGAYILAETHTELSGGKVRACFEPLREAVGAHEAWADAAERALTRDLFQPLGVAAGSDWVAFAEDAALARCEARARGSPLFPGLAARYVVRGARATIREPPPPPEQQQQQQQGGGTTTAAAAAAATKGGGGGNNAAAAAAAAAGGVQYDADASAEFRLLAFEGDGSQFVTDSECVPIEGGVAPSHAPDDAAAGGGAKRASGPPPLKHFWTWFSEQQWEVVRAKRAALRAAAAEDDLPWAVARAAVRGGGGGGGSAAAAAAAPRWMLDSEALDRVACDRVSVDGAGVGGAGCLAAQGEQVAAARLEVIEILMSQCATTTVGCVFAADEEGGTGAGADGRGEARPGPPSALLLMATGTSSVSGGAEDACLLSLATTAAIDAEVRGYALLSPALGGVCAALMAGPARSGQEEPSGCGVAGLRYELPGACWRLPEYAGRRAPMLYTLADAFSWRVNFDGGAPAAAKQAAVEDPARTLSHVLRQVDVSLFGRATLGAGVVRMAARDMARTGLLLHHRVKACVRKAVHADGEGDYARDAASGDWVWVPKFGPTSLLRAEPLDEAARTAFDNLEKALDHRSKREAEWAPGWLPLLGPLHGDLRADVVLVDHVESVWISHFAEARVGHVWTDVAALEASLLYRCLAIPVCAADLNTMGLAELRGALGVGEATAEAIVAWRQRPAKKQPRRKAGQVVGAGGSKAAPNRFDAKSFRAQLAEVVGGVETAVRAWGGRVAGAGGGGGGSSSSAAGAAAAQWGSRPGSPELARHGGAGGPSSAAADGNAPRPSSRNAHLDGASAAAEVRWQLARSSTRDFLVLLLTRLSLLNLVCQSGAVAARARP
jgi:hypothetical protein